MAALYSLQPPNDAYLRLEVISMITGVPEGTLREAASEATLKAKKKRGAWHSTLEFYNEWIETEDIQKSERGGHIRAASEREMAVLHEAERPKSQRKSQDDARSGGARSKKGDSRKRTRKGKRTVVYDICEELAGE